VSVLAARIDPDTPAGAVELLHAPDLFDAGAPVERRLGEAAAAAPDVAHLHQVDEPEIVAALQRTAPVLLSAHGYIACTSGVHYFRPGQGCTRRHGLGCIPNLMFRGCAHTTNPGRLPAQFRRAQTGLEALRRADLAVCYSSAVEQHLAVNAVAPRRVIPLFTTMAPAQGSGHETRRRVVSAGRVVAPKGVEYLIRAAPRVDAEFVVCGDGWRLEETRALARRLGVAERVRFTGWLSDEELARELAEASVVAIPSVWPEPFGLTGIEAFAAGRPVVASAVGGIADWLEDGVSGLLVEAGNAGELARALNELLADPARQQAMGNAGRESTAARFSAQRHVAALLDAYRDARADWESRRPRAPVGGAA
jgi:glycosyltransferase involved in cell wall biosynthesis